MGTGTTRGRDRMRSTRETGTSKMRQTHETHTMRQRHRRTTREAEQDVREAHSKRRTQGVRWRQAR